jgi:hypothetical protein
MSQAVVSVDLNIQWKGVSSPQIARVNCVNKLWHPVLPNLQITTTDEG